MSPNPLYSKDAPSGEFTFEFIPPGKKSSSTDNSTLEVDPDLMSTDDDADTQSLTDSVLDYPEEFGRTYSAYRQGSYVYPNDLTEQDRLELQYRMVSDLMHNKLHYAPFSPTQNPPKRVLDIGTGTGTWVLEFGDKYPSSHVIGIDISPIQPVYVPPNAEFIVDDAMSEWTWNQPFDYIHARVTMGCWEDYKTDVADKAFQFLKPGGWFEAQELSSLAFSDDGTLDPNGAFATWAREQNEASDRYKRPLSIAHTIKGILEASGFVDVNEVKLKLPVNPWPKDKRYKDLGRRMERNLQDGLFSFTVFIQNRVYNRSPEQIELALVPVRKDMSNLAVHSYHMLHVVYGRKPLPPDPFPNSVPIRGKPSSERDRQDVDMGGA